MTDKDIETARRKAARENEQPGGRKNNKAKAAVITVVIVLAVLLGGTTAAGFYVSGTDSIFPGVTIGGVTVGGMSRDEAIEALRAQGWDEERNDAVTVKLPLDKAVVVKAADVGAGVSASTAAISAYDYGHGGNIFGNLVKYIDCMFGGKELELVPEADGDAVRQMVDKVVGEVTNGLMASGLEVEDDVVKVVKGAKAVTIDSGDITNQIVTALKERNYSIIEYDVKVDEAAELDLEELHESVFSEPADAYYDAETKEIVDAVVGYDFDKDEARRLWDAADYGDTVEIPLIVTEPELTTEELGKMLFADELGTNTTSLSGSSANRLNNVGLAVKAIDGLVLAPGESFSYNETLGQRTTDKGYKPAGAYSNGQVVQEVGGGICQVSSTLYYSTLLANLKIDARTCHYFGVGYMPPGLDATVSWKSPDFKFTNDRDYPIRLDASVNSEKNTVTITVMGTNVDGSYVEMTYASWPVYNNSEYPEVATGYKAASYRNVYDKDGSLISKNTEAYSEYHYHEENIVYPSPSPSATPEPTAEPTTPPEPSAPVVVETDQPTTTPEVTQTPESTPTPEVTPPPADSGIVV